MDRNQAINIVASYGRHQTARKRMKNMSEAVARKDLLADTEIIGVVKEYIASGIALDNSVETRGLFGPDEGLTAGDLSG